MCSAPLSRLELKIVVDYQPEVELLVNGVDVLTQVEVPAARGGRETWYGCWRDPDTLLGPDSPLLPTAEPHAAALQRCGCMEEGCGTLMALVAANATTVTWQDFRRGQDDGYAYGTAAPWIPPIRFDRAQYEAEVARAHRDRSWEWPDRTCARLVREHLERSEELDARGYTLEWAGARFADREPGEWVPDGIRVFLDRERRQVVLEFPDATEAITERADTIARLILSRPEDEWPITFVSEEREWRR